MRLLFAGTPAVAVPSLRALIEHPGHEVVAVLTRPAAPSGRGRTLHASPVGEVADVAAIEVLSPDKPTDPQFVSRLAELGIDCCAVVGYGSLLREPTLSVPRYGWVNLHFSLLPAWRGAAPVQHAVLNGDDITGATTFLIGPGLDDGAVFGVLTEPIRPSDTSGDLLARLAMAGAGLMVATMNGIADASLQPKPQSESGVSHAPKLSVMDAQIRFGQPALAVDRRIRACTPAPGAWTLFRGQRLKLGAARPVADHDGEALGPGELSLGKSRLLIGTATVPLALGEVQPSGKKSMHATDWARGARIETGESLGG